MESLTELKALQKTTWTALSKYKLDSCDSRNVARYEKLAKLFQQLAKQIARIEAAEPQVDELENFINGA